MSIDVTTLAVSKNYTDKQIEKASIKGADLSGYVQSVNGVKPDKNGNVEVSGGNADQSGLTATAKTLLITILRNAVYNIDQSAMITALETELNNTDGSDVVKYTVSATLTNVSSNNAATSVESGELYTATITAYDGYTISSVTVTMDGTDITDEVYENGLISIPSVTGSVVIIATAVESGSGKVNILTAYPWVLGWIDGSKGEFKESYTNYYATEEFIAYSGDIVCEFTVKNLKALVYCYDANYAYLGKVETEYSVVGEPQTLTTLDNTAYIKSTTQTSNYTAQNFAMYITP